MPGPMSLLRSVEVVVVEETTRLYRVSRAREAEGFEEAFRSHYEQGLPPRGPEGRAAAIHMALSMFGSPDVAAQLAGDVLSSMMTAATSSGKFRPAVTAS